MEKEIKQAMVGDNLVQKARKDVLGFWHSANGEVTYQFAIAENMEYGDIFIKEKDTVFPVRFSFRITEVNGELSLEIDNAKYRILELRTTPQSVLSFETDKNNIVSLRKSWV